MLKKLKVKALKLMFDYHHYLGDFYLNRINKSNCDKNGKYWTKLKRHANKEYKLIEQIYTLEGI